MDDCKISRQNKYRIKEWMAATLSVTKRDALFQRKDGCSKSGEINITP